MAKMTTKTTKIKKMVEVEESIKTFNLELTQPELNVLSCILRVVGGSPYNSGRKYAQSICDAIYGHSVIDLPRHQSFAEKSDHLFFKEGTDKLFEN